MSDITSLISALAWPATVLFIFWCLRKNLSGLLDRTRSVRHGDTQVDFNEHLREAADASAKEALQESNGSSANTPLDEMIADLIEVDPYSAILASWVKFLEAARSAVGDSKSSSNAVILINKLRDQNRISEQDAELLNLIRRLRNDAVHHRSEDLSQSTAYKACMVLQTLSKELSE